MLLQSKLDYVCSTNLHRFILYLLQFINQFFTVCKQQKTHFSSRAHFLAVNEIKYHKRSLFCIIKNTHLFDLN